MKFTIRRNKKTGKVSKGQKLQVRPAVKKAMTAIAKRVVHRAAENKVIGWQVEKNVTHNSAISAADCEALIKQVQQINATSTLNTSLLRSGDRITPRSLTVKGVLACGFDLANTTNTPLMVRVVIAAQKNIKVGSLVDGGGVDASRLLRPGLDLGAGTDQVPFNGDAIDLTYPINKDLFRVYYDKIHQISPNTGSAVETNPFQVKRWSYKFKQLPASLTYDEGNGDWNNNFAPFVAIGWAYPDGTGPTIGVRLMSNIYSKLEFEDV